MTAPETHADDIFAVHAALAKMAASMPSLDNNPVWIALRKQIFEQFEAAFVEVDL